MFETELKQERLGIGILYEGDSFDTLKFKFAKSIIENSHHRFAHNALPPVISVEFIANFSIVMFFLNAIEATGANNPVGSLERDSPDHTLLIFISLVDALDLCQRL